MRDPGRNSVRRTFLTVVQLRLCLAELKCPDGRRITCCVSQHLLVQALARSDSSFVKEMKQPLFAVRDNDDKNQGKLSGIRLPRQETDPRYVKKSVRSFWLELPASLFIRMF